MTMHDSRENGPSADPNTLFQYDLTAEVPIVRLVYDPTNNDTIAAAEWFLR